MKGHIREVRPGVWRAWVDLPRLDDNKRRQRCFTINAGGKRDADRQLAKLIADACAGEIAAPTKLTVESYLVQWLEKREVEGLAPKSLELWRNLSRFYVTPYIGKVVLERLTPNQIDGLYTKLLTSGRRQCEGGLSPATVGHVHRLLTGAMKSAVRLKLISRNPCEGLAPKVVEKERENIRDFDAECVRELLARVEGHWIKVPVLLAATMGMRRGEVLALTWADVDLNTGALKVDKAVSQLQGQAPMVKRPKRERTRKPTMPQFLIEALRRHKGQQAAHRLQLGPAWEDNGLVCPNELGRCRSPEVLSGAFRDLLDTTDLPRITFHDLRHVNATLLLLSGVPDKVVADRLGHKDTKITRDLYQHVLPQMDQAAAAATDDFFRRATGDRAV